MTKSFKSLFVITWSSDVQLYEAETSFLTQAGAYKLQVTHIFMIATLQFKEIWPL